MKSSRFLTATGLPKEQSVDHGGSFPWLKLVFEVTLTYWAVKHEGKAVDQTSAGKNRWLCLNSITWVTGMTRE